jgi:hypothetical protein
MIPDSSVVPRSFPCARVERVCGDGQRHEARQRQSKKPFAQFSGQEGGNEAEEGEQGVGPDAREVLFLVADRLAVFPLQADQEKPTPTVTPSRSSNCWPSASSN